MRRHSLSADAKEETVTRKVFDLEQAIHHCADDREMFEAMVGYFFDEADRTVDELRAAMVAGDAAAVARIAHRFKGTVGYLGAQTATDATRRVERSGIDGDLSCAAPRVAELAQEVELLKRELTPYRPASNAPE
jgi:HPt (histidine-containing phosphotransfer) domain-containing protein